MASLTQKPRYVYSTEISSMVYVFCGIKDADEELVQFIEEVVKKEMVELVRLHPRLLSVPCLTDLALYRSYKLAHRPHGAADAPSASRTSSSLSGTTAPR